MKKRISVPSNTNNEPTIRYSEEVYKSLLEAHELNDESSDTLSACEDEDPLALDYVDDIQETKANTDQIRKSHKEKLIQYQIISETNSKVTEIKKELVQNLQEEEQFLYEEIEDQPEFIKIEIVEDDLESRAELSNSEGITNEDGQQSIKHKLSVLRPNDLAATIIESFRSLPKPKDEPATKRKSKATNPTLKSKKFASTKLPTKKRYPLAAYTDLASIELRPKDPLSQKVFALMELNFTYNFDILDDQRLPSFTGITSDVLQACEKCVENTLYTNKISDAKNIRLKIILALMKLKSNLSCNVLATVLGLKENICRDIFFWVLELLSLALKPAICWFTGKELKDGKAKCFHGEAYKQVRVVLNELKFKVHKCQKMQCDINLCEQYKKHEFVRVIVGLSPKGNLFSFVSNSYDFNISVESVLRKEKFFSHFCNQGDTIVISESVDSILIKEDCRREGLLLKVLDELKGEVKDHVNKVFQKFEEFELLRSKEISSHMVPVIGKAVSVICSVLNLSFEAENTEKLQ